MVSGSREPKLDRAKAGKYGSTALNTLVSGPTTRPTVRVDAYMQTVTYTTATGTMIIGTETALYFI